MITLYGIPNCGTVKKARVWLTEQQRDYTFHDFKKQGIDAAHLERWASTLGLDKLINRQGTTWRKLSDEDKARASTLAGALALMQVQPSVIKRPVVEYADQVLVGFNEASWTEVFGQ